MIIKEPIDNDINLSENMKLGLFIILSLFEKDILKYCAIAKIINGIKRQNSIL